MVDIDEDCLDNLEKKVDMANMRINRVNGKVDEVLMNHLPHIDQRIDKTEIAITKIDTKMESWNWKLWAGVISAIASVFMVVIAFLGLFV